MRFNYLFVFGLTIFGYIDSYAQYYEASFKKDVAPLAIGVSLAGLGLVLDNNVAELVYSYLSVPLFPKVIEGCLLFLFDLR